VVEFISGGRKSRQFLARAILNLKPFK